MGSDLLKDLEQQQQRIKEWMLELEAQLTHLDAIINFMRRQPLMPERWEKSLGLALMENALKEIPRKSKGVIPPIVHITGYIREKGSPQHQNDIIRDVGNLRKELYPNLTYHYSNVWRALEYHSRKGSMIQCVNRDGQPVALKRLPARPGTRGGLPNEPQLYQQDNWFSLKEAVPLAMRDRGRNEALTEGKE